MSLFAIFAAGLLTFASPCVLPLIPIHLSVLAGASVADLRQGRRTGRALWAALAFSLGLLLVFIALGLAASAAGRVLLEHRTLLLQLGGLLVFVFGLKYLGYLKVPWLERDVRPALERFGRHGGLLGGFVFGAAFGLGWTPCIGPVLGSVLTYAAGTSTSPATGALYLAIYAAGLIVPLLAMAAAAPLALRWHRRLLPHVRRLEVATGALLAVTGVLLVTDQLSAITPSFGPALVASASPQPELEPEPRPEPGPQLAFAEPSSSGATGATCGAAAAAQGECSLPDVAAPLPGATPDGLALVNGTRGAPRLVEFLSRSCPICQRMEPILQAAESGCTGNGVSFVRVDVGTPAGRRAADELRIRGVPTFLLLDAAGSEVARLVGEVPLNVLKQSLEVLAGETCDGFRALPAR